jgi:hypothetical protein
MQESEAHGVPTWLVMALAVVVPLILATLFGGLLEWSNRISECAEWNTASCLATAARNNRIGAAAWAGAVDLCRAGWMAPWAQHTGAGGVPAYFHPMVRSGVLLLVFRSDGEIARTCDESISPAPNGRRI